MFKENRYIFFNSSGSTGKKDIPGAAKGLFSADASAVTHGLLDGEPNPVQRLRQSSDELPKGNIGRVIETTKKGIGDILKLPTTVVKKLLQPIANITEGVSNAAHNIVESGRSIGFSILAIGPLLWEKVTKLPAKAIQKITGTINEKANAVIAKLPEIQPANDNKLPPQELKKAA
jgi:hypothetical protein